MAKKKGSKNSTQPIVISKHSYHSINNIYNSEYASVNRNGLLFDKNFENLPQCVSKTVCHATNCFCRKFFKLLTQAKLPVIFGTIRTQPIKRPALGPFMTFFVQKFNFFLHMPQFCSSFQILTSLYSLYGISIFYVNSKTLKNIVVAKMEIKIMISG